MNCNTCRYELSQCLDGRLPSGRRAVVMQHVDGCEVCSAFWAELQAAQQLTLQLPKERVSEGFRDQLWERIRAGEGTPDAVFHEPVPMLTKARYLLTGAAAAAAVLMIAAWLRNDGNRPIDTDRATVDQVADGRAIDSRATDGRPTDRGNRLRPTDTRNTQDAIDGPSAHFVQENSQASDPMPPMLASAQRLTADLVAVEAARQFEQRYVSANQNLARLKADPTRSGPVLVRRLLDDARELHTFAGLLLDLRDNNRVSFRDDRADTNLDAEVGADLRFVTTMLGQCQEQPLQQDMDNVRAFVAPALQQSNRLGSLARLIHVRPSFNWHEEREEQDVLVRLNTLQPEVFAKLFYVLPSNDNCVTFRVMAPGTGIFQFDGQCGPSFVAPRSRVEEGNQRLQMQLESTGSTGGTRREITVEFHVGGEKKHD